MRVAFGDYDGIGPRPAPVALGEEEVIAAELVLLAIGFRGAEPDRLHDGLGVAIGERGTIRADEGYATGVPGVFACGDAVRGADLIVTAIADGRECARAVERLPGRRVAAAVARSGSGSRASADRHAFRSTR